MDHVAGFRGLRFGAANLVVGRAEEVAQLAEEPIRPHPELRLRKPARGLVFKAHRRLYLKLIDVFKAHRLCKLCDFNFCKLCDII